jgi:hypothetical protein
MALVLPSLNTARSSALLLLLQSRMDLHDNQPREAVEHALAAMALARNVGQQKVMVSNLVEIGIETKAIDTLLALLPKLPRDVVQTLPAKLAALPRPITAAQTIEAEFKFGRAAARQQNIPVEIFEAAKPFYDAVARATTQPAEQFDATVDAEALKLFANPFPRIIAPTLKPFMETQRKIDSKRRQLQDACTRAAAGVSNRP